MEPITEEEYNAAEAERLSIFNSGNFKSIYDLEPELRARYNALYEITSRYERAQYEAMGSIINKMYDESVFKVEIDKENKTIEFIDGCDEVFVVTLTKDEVIQLSNELRALADRL